MEETENIVGEIDKSDSSYLITYDHYMGLIKEVDVVSIINFSIIRVR